MKCLILAGGSGDRLWPLSRKNYPKQFMEIRRGRSLFQETVLRNIPFCDEFIIITNVKYESIVKGQLQEFQDLKYSVIMEESPLKTAISVVTIALNSDGEEEFLIVSTDNFIDGEYNSYITRLKEIIKQNKIGLVGAMPKNEAYGSHYIEKIGDKVRYASSWNKHCYLDCGIIGCKASVFLKNVEKDFLNKCKNISIHDNCLIESKTNTAEHKSLAAVLKSDDMELVRAKFSCVRITDILSYYNSLGKEQDFSNVIDYKCRNVKIINSASDKLVLAHNLRDVVIANTRDAVYITKVENKDGIKEIPESYFYGRDRFFNEYPVFYNDWGVSETLSVAANYKVSKITVYPKNTLEEKTEKGIHTNLFVLEGNVSVCVNGKGSTSYKSNASVSIGGGVNYSVTNTNKNSIILIKTESKQCSGQIAGVADSSCFVKMKPALKDFIWGGTQIRDKLKKETGKLKRIAESWELSAHPAGESSIATGEFKGLTFSEFLSRIDKNHLGWKARDYDRFPIMIKFIDAKESLSIQVHPDDEYAFFKEGDYGKNEMWYIMSAEANAYIYIGFNKDVTEEEITERINNGTIGEVLNKIPVKQGETYFLKTGTVHAIGEGCLICEIQQSSNITYRLYDYGRKDDKGDLRELKIKEALDVADKHKSETARESDFSVIKFQGYTKKLLGQCKYFVVTKYDITNELTLAPTGASFRAVIVLEGKGKIGNGRSTFNTSIGDTWFCGSQEIVTIKGDLTVLVVNI